MIRICFLGPYSYPLFTRLAVPGARFTGVDVQLYGWASVFAKKNDVEISYIVGDYGQSKVLTVENIKLYRWSKPGNSTMSQGLVNLIKLFVLLVKIRPNLVITQGLCEPMVFETVLFRKILRYKNVHMIASDADLHCISGQKVDFFQSLHRRTLLKTHVLTSQNDYQKQTLEECGISSIRINNALSDIGERNNTPLINRKYDALWLASAQEVKRPELFLKLVQAAPKGKFCMVLAPHDQALYKKISKEAKKYKNLDFVGGVDYRDTAKYFAQAKTFVITSAYEGFPNTIIQALMFGTPILSLNTNPNSIFAKGVGYYFSDDFSGMAERFQGILRDKERLTRCSKNARQLFLDEYDTRTVGDLFWIQLSKLI